MATAAENSAGEEENVIVLVQAGVGGGLQDCQFQPQWSDHKSSPGSSDTSGSESKEVTNLSKVDNRPKRPVAEWQRSSSRCVPHGTDARVG